MVSSTSQAQSVRVRSPNYPVLSLGEAIQKVRTVYQKEYTHAATREVVAKDLGYAGVNGASAGVISALVKYGLMEHVGDGIKISSDGLDVVLHRKGDPEYASAIQRAALLPGLFRELHDLYGGSLPSDHSLRAYLQKRGFNPKVVDSVIRIYRETLEFVDGQSDGLPQPVEGPGIEAATFQNQPPDESAMSQARPGPTAALEGKVTSFQLSEECNARIIFTGRVTQDDIDLLVDLIKLNKRAYPRSGVVTPDQQSG